jgi:Eukaryotic mitochondrial regulator protein
MRMLPQTPYNEEKPRPHESINDLPVHPATTQQIFWPVAESRQFTREDAGNVFRPGLKAADLRIPHPEMVIKNQTEAEMTRSMRMKKELELAQERKEMEKKYTVKDEKISTVIAGKWSFKIQDVNIDATVGKQGRGRNGVGWRYGMPFDDRKRGVVKIPTSVP